MREQRSYRRWRALTLFILFNMIVESDALSMNAHHISSSQLNAQIPDSITTNDAPLGIYIHIPYCRRRCRYCDFAIVPIGTSTTTVSSTTSSALMQESNNDRANKGFRQMDLTYRNALLEELNLIQKKQDQHSNMKTSTIRSIYFGGGTPSLAPVDTIAAILNQIQNIFLIANDVEITMEMDPGTFGLDQLQALKQLGINRISLGVQSFHDTVLQHIGRVHRSADIYYSVHMLQLVYGDTVNYSIDLISGLPGDTLVSWVETLELATQLVPKPRHMSLYDLQIESGTVFDKLYNSEAKSTSTPPPTTTTNINIPSSDDCAFMYKYASGFLKYHGYHHYEISSYSIPGHRSRHNQIYWHPHASWYAIGLGATSSIHGTRYSRPRAMQDYINWVHEQTLTDTATPEWMVVQDHHGGDVLMDIILTRLRTSEGLDLDNIAQDYGMDKVESILQGAQLGLDLDLAQVDANEGQQGKLRLRDPNGFLFSNSIISSIFAELGMEGQ